MNPLLQSSLTSFAAAFTKNSNDHKQMTDEEQQFLLNDSFVRMHTLKQTVETTAALMKTNNWYHYHWYFSRKLEERKAENHCDFL